MSCSCKTHAEYRRGNGKKQPLRTSKVKNEPTMQVSEKKHETVVGKIMSKLKKSDNGMQLQ